MSNQEVKQSGPFYGWNIVGMGAVCLFVMMGGYYAYGAYFGPLLMEFKVGVGAIALIGSIMGITFAAFGIIGGVILDKWGQRVVSLISAILVGAGLILASRASSLPQIYVAFGVIFGGSIGTVINPLYATVGRWFEQKRGMATGLFNVGAGIGGVAVPLLITRIIISSGWRTAMLVWGVVSMVVLLVGALVLRTDPSDKGLRPYGATGPVTAHGGHDLSKLPGMTVKQAVGTPAFWLIFLASILNIGMNAMVGAHLIYFGETRGLTPTNAALLMTVYGGVTIAGQLGGPFLTEKINKKYILAAVGVLDALCFLIFNTTHNPGALYAATALTALGAGACFPVTMILLAQIVGLKKLGTLISLIGATSAIGASLGTWFAGNVVDRTGSYNQAWWVGIGIAIVMAVLFVLVPMPKAPKAAPSADQKAA